MTLPDPTRLLPVAALACLLAARSLQGVPSGLLFGTGLLLLAAWPGARLASMRRRGTMAPGREKRALLVAVTEIGRAAWRGRG